ERPRLSFAARQPLPLPEPICLPPRALIGHVPLFGHAIFAGTAAISIRGATALRCYSGGSSLVFPPELRLRLHVLSVSTLTNGEPFLPFGRLLTQPSASLRMPC